MLKSNVVSTSMPISILRDSNIVKMSNSSFVQVQLPACRISLESKVKSKFQSNSRSFVQSQDHSSTKARSSNFKITVLSSSKCRNLSFCPNVYVILSVLSVSDSICVVGVSVSVLIVGQPQIPNIIQSYTASAAPLARLAATGNHELSWENRHHELP